MIRRAREAFGSPVEPVDSPSPEPKRVHTPRRRGAAERVPARSSRPPATRSGSIPKAKIIVAAVVFLLIMATGVLLAVSGPGR
jgi:hypothetical protein